MSQEDLKDIALLTLAAASIAGALLLREYCRPLPLYRRVAVRLGLS
jgi:hypothetical protein